MKFLRLFNLHKENHSRDCIAQIFFFNVLDTAVDGLISVLSLSILSAVFELLNSTTMLDLLSEIFGLSVFHCDRSVVNAFTAFDSAQT